MKQPRRKPTLDDQVPPSRAALDSAWNAENDEKKLIALTQLLLDEVHRRLHRLKLLPETDETVAIAQELASIEEAIAQTFRGDDLQSLRKR